MCGATRVFSYIVKNFSFENLSRDLNGISKEAFIFFQKITMGINVTAKYILRMRSHIGAVPARGGGGVDVWEEKQKKKIETEKKCGHLTKTGSVHFKKVEKKTSEKEKSILN